MRDAKKQIKKILLEILEIDSKIILNSIVSPKSEFGDLSTTICFYIAKKQKKNPNIISKELREKIKEKIKHSDIFKDVIETGPYINFFFKDSYFLKQIKKQIKNKKKSKNILIEFPSVNPNKPWHIGHLRNALIGDSMANLFSFLKYNVTRIDYINDLGLQVAESFYAQNYLNLKEKSKEKFDHYIGKNYVKINKTIENNKEMQKQVREILKKIEQRDEKVYKKARNLVEKCVLAQYETANNFNITHDFLIFESDIINTFFKKAMEFLKNNKAVFLENKGKNKDCYVVRLKDKKDFEKLTNADKILIRSDSTATYTGKDVIFHLWKFNIINENFKFKKFLFEKKTNKYCYMSSENGKKIDFNFADISINVIGMEQEYPQKVIKFILEKLNFKKQANNFFHISYAHASLPNMKISGRTGTWIGYSADEIFSITKQKAKEKINEKYKKQEIEKISDKVTNAAIRFAFLKVGFEKEIVFKINEALNFQGESGPYLQYTYARQKSILNKAKQKNIKVKLHDDFLLSKTEKNLIKKISEFNDVLSVCKKQKKINILCDYLIDLCSLFNTFYSNNPVLKNNDKKIISSRLYLVFYTNKILKMGLEILGIDAIEKM